MSYVIVNFILYVIALCCYWQKRRKIDGGFILLAFYAIVAFLGIELYIADPSKWDFQLLPFLYLFIICMIFFRQFFFDSDTLYQKLKKPNVKVLSVFSFIYIICSLISIYYGLGNAWQNISSESLSKAYINNALGRTEWYANQLDRFAKIFAQYFQPIAILTVFYYLTLQNIKPIKITLLSLAVFLPTFISSIIIGNRSMIVQLMILIIISYIIFHRGISKKRKQIIMIPSIIFIIIVFLYMSMITIARFGEGGATSILYYMGHSMLTFDYGVADTIHTFSYGRYFFSWFINLFGGDSNLRNLTLGTHCYGAFFTFVGAFYMDFGPIGTFFLALIIPSLISLLFKNKKHIDMANIFIYVFSLNYFTYGGLIVAAGSSLTWLMAFIVFGILKIFQNA